MPCGHVFHDGCILPWLQKHNSCPVCQGSESPGPWPESPPAALEESVGGTAGSFAAIGSIGAILVRHPELKLNIPPYQSSCFV